MVWSDLTMILTMLWFDLIMIWYDLICMMTSWYLIWYISFNYITVCEMMWCEMMFVIYIYIYIMFVDLFFSCAIGLMWVNHELVNLWSESVINPWVSWVRQCCSRSLKWSLFGARVRAARSPGTLHPEDPFQRKSCYIIYIYILVKSLNCNVYTRNA